jgi:signal transduction histidine kinase
LLDEAGLVSALRWLVGGVRDRSGIQTTLDLQPIEFPRLSPEVERTVFRIVQEALTNVFRHSDARVATVSVVQKDSRLVIHVMDNGKGISEQTLQLQPDSIGVGIGGMRERARELGGELRMLNASPGTIVEVVIPSAVPASAAAAVAD